MTQTNMRRGFTMIELVFVIVIIGILAAVAIPRLAANRDDATAATCVQQIGNIVSEATTQYAKLGYSDFQTLRVGGMTNVKTSATDTATGLTQADTALVKDGLGFVCEGGKVVDITFGQSPDSNATYEMQINVSGASTAVPAAIKAVEIVKKNYNITDTNTTISL